MTSHYKYFLLLRTHKLHQDANCIVSCLLHSSYWTPRKEKQHRVKAEILFLKNRPSQICLSLYSINLTILKCFVICAMLLNCVKGDAPPGFHGNHVYSTCSCFLLIPLSRKALTGTFSLAKMYTSFKSLQVDCSFVTINYIILARRPKRACSHEYTSSWGNSIQSSSMPQ